MGLFDDDLELDDLLEEVRNDAFVPRTLSTDNVHFVFNKCVSEDEPGTTSGVLFTTIGGYAPKVNDIMFFNNQKLSENRQTILFLLGQLACVHTADSTPDINNLTLNYFSEKWTTDNIALLELLYMASAIEVLAPFNAKGNTTIIDLSTLKPTLSPRDPFFETWWEEHKDEWETK